MVPYAALCWARPAVVLDPVAGKYLHRSVVHFHREMDSELALTVAENLTHIVVEPKHLGGNLELLDGNAEEVSLFADLNGASVDCDLCLVPFDDHGLLHYSASASLRRIPLPTA